MTIKQIQSALEIVQEALKELGGGAIHISTEGVSVDDEEGTILLDEGTAVRAAVILKGKT
jgi:hypothetical protein